MEWNGGRGILDACGGPPPQRVGNLRLPWRDAKRPERGGGNIVAVSYAVAATSPFFEK
jgi:hypothetical protein